MILNYIKILNASLNNFGFFFRKYFFDVNYRIKALEGVQVVLIIHPYKGVRLCFIL